MYFKNKFVPLSCILEVATQFGLYKLLINIPAISQQSKQEKNEAIQSYTFGEAYVAEREAYLKNYLISSDSTTFCCKDLISATCSAS